MEELQGAFELTPFYCGPAVYFLVSGDEVVYVGQTVCLLKRLADHFGRDIHTFGQFDRIFFLPTPAVDLLRVEAFWIAKLCPRLNSSPESRARNKAKSDEYSRRLWAELLPRLIAEGHWNPEKFKSPI